MTLFWILALALCVVAAAFIVGPLYLRKDSGASTGRRVDVNLGIYEERLAELEQSFEAGEMDAEELEHLKTELKKNLLTDAGDTDESAPEPSKPFSRKIPVALALLVPVFAVVAYSDWGLSWGAIKDVELAQEMKSADPHEVGDMSGVVAKLAQRLQSEPNNHEGWFLLGQSYLSLGMYSRAADAFRHLQKTFPNDGGLASHLAQALYLADQRQFTPRVKEAVDRTLALNPNDIAMLEIRGLDAYESGNLQGALDDFRQALANAEGKRADVISGVIGKIESQLGVPPEQRIARADPVPATAGAAAADAPKKAASARRIEVNVSVADGVHLGGDETVFVYAKALKGPPMPLAVQRFGVSALPRSVELTEAMAMMPGMGLANFDQVQVIARISNSGIANVSPDDFQAVSDPIDLTQAHSPISLRISKRVGAQ